MVDGPLLECSAVFHAFDGEELGIDVAIVYTVTEPGSPTVLYAYRTLSLVRQCGMGNVVLRLNHDVITEGMQGRSFINQINLQTAQVIRMRFSHVEYIVIEPDRDISYHINYTKNGFLWRLQDPPLMACPAPSWVGDCSPHASGKVSPFTKYRAQIDLDPQRYPTMWFKIPTEGERPSPRPASTFTRTLKRTRRI